MRLTVNQVSSISWVRVPHSPLAHDIGKETVLCALTLWKHSVYSLVTQWQSVRLLTGMLLVRVQPREQSFITVRRGSVLWNLDQQVYYAFHRRIQLAN